jgi:xylulokinase
MWWENACKALKEVISLSKDSAKDISAIGITYQMHGLVYLDRNGDPLGDSIIWCDSRAVNTGNMLAEKLGTEYCRQHLLNSPGNFTASKLKWLMEDQPSVYEKVFRIMLPGDYIAYRLTGEMNTTPCGLSEGIFWDFAEDRISERLLEVSGISGELLPGIVPAFGFQGKVLPEIAEDLGIPAGTPVTYRAGDQPNNAFSLNVMEPGELAATAGTSGVVYGVTDRMISDLQNRINTFAHVNHTGENPRLGVLLCINGTGIMNSWVRKILGNGVDYEKMNAEAMQIMPGSDGLMVLPFLNGAERMLNNRDIGGNIYGMDFNKHGRAHFFRAVQEGIAFAFRYGIDIMKEIGIVPSVIRAGNANMFLSPLFRQFLADVCHVTIDLYETDGATGAAIGAAVGAGNYNTYEEAFSGIKKIKMIDPSNECERMAEYYFKWKDLLETTLIESERLKKYEHYTR